MLASIKSHRARDTVTLLQRETPEFTPPRYVATQFPGFESGEIRRLVFPSREGLSFACPCCEGVESRDVNKARVVKAKAKAKAEASKPSPNQGQRHAKPRPINQSYFISVSKPNKVQCNNIEL